MSAESEAARPEAGAREWREARYSLEVLSRVGVIVFAVSANKLDELLEAYAQHRVAQREARITALDRQVMDWENREAAICPEDYGFEEVIAERNKRIDELIERVAQREAEITQLKQELRDLKRDLQFLKANLCERHQQVCLCSTGPCGMCRAETALAAAPPPPPEDKQ